MTERKGRCLCGSITYRLTADPLASRICWCRDCQRIAANGTVNVIVPTEALEVSGRTSEHTGKADSGNLLTREFCPGCGVHLFSRSSARPQFRVVRAGTLDDPSSIRPAANIWTKSAPAWVCMDSSLEAHEGQPPPPRPAEGVRS